MLTRREFLKAAGGAMFYLAVVGSAGLLSGLSDPKADNWVGPKVRDGLVFREEGEDIRAYYKGEPVLVTNRPGMELIQKADGTRTLEELLRQGEAAQNQEMIVDFYLALGQSGWLENRLEVSKYAVSV